MPAYNEITPKTLYRLIGTPQAPLIIDLRIDDDFDDDPRLVPSAIRRRFQDLPQLIETIERGTMGGHHQRRQQKQKVVFYCQKGRKISQGAAALLRIEGLDVEVLEGGQFAWRDAGLPMVQSSGHAAVDFTKPSRWISKHRPKIDRIACPWLVRRFIDPFAEFMFVPGQDVALAAEKFHAIPFDIDVEGAGFSHRGDFCTFDALLADFGLSSDPLSDMALVVRAADCNAHHLAPQAAGLVALSVGLSRMYKDDLAQLEAGMLLYDALYRWARDGKDEGHDWPNAAASA